MFFPRLLILLNVRAILSFLYHQPPFEFERVTQKAIAKKQYLYFIHQ